MYWPLECLAIGSSINECVGEMVYERVFSVFYYCFAIGYCGIVRRVNPGTFPDHLSPKVWRSRKARV